MDVRTTFRSTVLTFTIVVATSLCSTVIPGLNLAALTDSSDLIIAGQVLALKEAGHGIVRVNGKQFSSIRMLATIHVDQVLKGSFGSPRLEVGFDLPISPAGSMGYRGVPAGAYRLVFLRGSTPKYELANPFYPSVVASPGFATLEANVMKRVIGQIAAVLESPTTTDAEKLEAMSTLYRVNDPLITSGLRRALKHKSEVVRLSAVAELLNRNDISVLPIAVDALLHPKTDLPEYVRQNLSAAIGASAANDEAITTISQLLQAANPDIRRNAASALRNTSSKAAIGPLVLTLSDRDFQVRYYGVIGLAEITGQNEWRPLIEDFQTNEARYLKHWKNWAQANQHR